MEDILAEAKKFKISAMTIDNAAMVTTYYPALEGVSQAIIEKMVHEMSTARARRAREVQCGDIGTRASA